MTEIEAVVLYKRCKTRGWYPVFYHHHRGEHYCVVGYEPGRGWRLLLTPEALEA